MSHGDSQVVQHAKRQYCPHIEHETRTCETRSHLIVGKRRIPIDDCWFPLGRGVGCADCGLGVACTFVALATYFYAPADGRRLDLILTLYCQCEQCTADARTSEYRLVSLTTIPKCIRLRNPLEARHLAMAIRDVETTVLRGPPVAVPPRASVPGAIKKEPAPYQRDDPITLARTGSRRELLLLVTVL